MDSSSKLAMETENRALSEFGFRFNPFAHLDSSADRHLPEYLVDNQAFSLAHEEQPSMVVARPGAGKTAMRIAVSQACLMGHSGRQTLPIIYNLPDYFSRPGDSISYQDHLRGLLQAAAGNLMLYYSFRPEQFAALSGAARNEINGLLCAHLPMALPIYLGVLEQTYDPNELIRQLERTYPSSAPPALHLTESFCRLLEIEGDAWTGTAQEQFDRLCSVLRDTLAVRNVFILIDGVDAFPQSSQSLSVQLQLVSALCVQAEAFAQAGLYIKLFLPSALPLEPAHAFRTILINWKEDQIAHLLRKRVFAATEARIGSLDAMAELGLSQIEETLANEAGLPREAVYLSGRLLYNLLQHSEKTPAQINAADLDAAIEWYRTKKRERERTGK